MRKLVMVIVFLMFGASLCYSKVELNYRSSSCFTEPNDFVIDGNYVYSAFYNGLITYEINENNGLDKVSRLFLDGEGKRVKKEGDCLYFAAGEKGVYIIDVSDPEHPLVLANYDTPGEALDVSVQDNILYVADGEECLQVIDFSNIYNPEIIGSYKTNLPFTGGPISTRVGIQNSCCFLISTPALIISAGDWQPDNTNYFEILDVSDPSSITQLGSYSNPGSSLLEICDTLAYVIDNGGLSSITINDPSNIQGKLIYQFNEDYSSRNRRLALHGDTALFVYNWHTWTAQDTSLIELVDISDIDNAQLISSGVIPYYIQDIRYSDSQVIASFCDRPGQEIGIGLLNLNPEPQFNELTHIQTGFHNLTLLGDDLYSVDNWDQSIHAYNINDLDYVHRVSKFKKLDTLYPQLLKIFDSLFYIKTDENILITNTIDSLLPEQVLGQLNRYYDFTVNNDKLFAVSSNYLTILDISDMANPVVISSTYLGFSGRSIALKENLVFIGGTTDGFVVYDISDPRWPSKLSSFVIGKEVRKIKLSGSLALLTDQTFNFHTIDVTDPTSPQLIESSNYELKNIYDICIIDDSLVALAGELNAFGNGNIKLVNLSEPYNYHVECSYTTPLAVTSIAYKDSALYLSNKTSLQIISLQTDYPTDAHFSTSVDEIYPITFELHNNYPNPFNPSTVISFNLAENSYICLEVLNALGQNVKTLLHQNMNAGEYNIVWNGDNESGENIAAGVYFFRLTNGQFSKTRKMVLIK